MQKLRVSLEWFLNPDHLPMVLGIVLGKYKEHGIDVELIEPTDHYDGFRDLVDNKIDIHINEPLHLFEHYFDGIKSLGCYFETDGGVMIRESSIDKLKSDKQIKITTPASNSVTNKIGFEVLKRYAKKEGFNISKDNVEFIENDFYHIDNMLKDDSLDGAWLCFYNFEGIEAEHRDFKNLFINQHNSPYPNFSALEMMSTEQILDTKEELISKFVIITNDMVKYAKNNPIESSKIYYEYSKNDKNAIMDNIIIDSIDRFISPLNSSEDKWYELYKFLEELEIISIDISKYSKIFKI
jgi:ABC-type nitrate/sulfonate/bicarbonate transport system substrate-binding protein